MGASTMADYYARIVNVVANLPQHTNEARRALYKRSRYSLSVQLMERHGKNPMMSSMEINSGGICLLYTSDAADE